MAINGKKLVEKKALCQLWQHHLMHTISSSWSYFRLTSSTSLLTWTALPGMANRIDGHSGAQCTAPVAREAYRRLCRDVLVHRSVQACTRHRRLSQPHRERPPCPWQCRAGFRRGKLSVSSHRSSQRRRSEPRLVRWTKATKQTLLDEQTCGVWPARMQKVEKLLGRSQPTRSLRNVPALVPPKNLGKLLAWTWSCFASYCLYSMVT